MLTFLSRVGDANSDRAKFSQLNSSLKGGPILRFQLLDVGREFSRDAVRQQFTRFDLLLRRQAREIDSMLEVLDG